jgi:hypothetical protein
VFTLDYAEASFYEGEVFLRTEGEVKLAKVKGDVIVLTFSSGIVRYYSAIKNTLVKLPTGGIINCHCDPLFFADLLANFFS